jgi:glycosyltransferase involved in cell wall biosynthesis
MSKVSDHNYSISALLPVKNGAPYLETLLPLILEMLEPSDELIVINDGSTDSTEKIILDYKRIDSRLRSVATEGIGLVKSLNLGVSMSKKFWIARFDVDDSYSILRLQRQREKLEFGVSVVFSDYRFLSGSNKGLGTVHSAVYPNPTAISLVSSQRTAHPSAVINRHKLLMAGGYLEEDFPAEDLGLWLRLSHFGKLISVPQTLLSYRLGKNSISSNNRKAQLSKTRVLINDYSNWIPLYQQAQLDFKQTVRDYLALSGGPERVFLHIRELKLIEKKILSVSKYLPRLLSIGFFPTIRIGLAGIRCGFLALLRRIYRFI